MRRILTTALLSLAMVPLVVQCTSPNMEGRLRKLEAQQDSILKILTTMKDQGEFVAMRVGWRPAADTLPKDIPIGTSFSQGPDKALLTIVEFSDLQCPYCSQFAPILDSLSHAYPNDVRVIFKHFPLSFHPQARAAAAAAIAAGRQGKFFEFRYKVAPHFKNLSDSLYLAVAKDIGLDLNRFKKEMALTPEINKVLEEDMDLGRKVGVEGTPTIFVNGRLAQDRSFDYFVRLIRQTKG
jgi:protein-disulfide isomerase